MIKIDKFSYKSLRKLTVGERLNAVKNPEVGHSLLSALTPTQIAELFPRYYLMREPDISGFLRAVPSSVQEAKQKYYDEQLQRTASGAREGMAPIEPSGKKTWWDKVKETVSDGTARVLKAGEAPKYKLTPEQTATYELLKSGQNIEANDPRTKFMATLTPEQMKMVGLEKIKTDDGKEMFRFNPEAFKATEEEAKKKISAGGADSTAMAALKKEISRGEGDYGAYNRGRAGDTPKNQRTIDITQLSVGEILQRQQGPDRSFMAVGKYQFIPQTLKEAVRYTRMDPNTKFDAAAQEKLFTYLISAEKRPALNAYLTGKSKDANAALNDLANEFASIPGPSGRGKYEGLAGNAAMGGAARAERIKGLLEEAQKTYNDPINIDYSQQAIDAKRRQIELERSTAAVDKLAEYTGATVGAPGAPGVSNTAQNEGTKKLSEITSYHSAGKGYCGIGTRLAARDLFGDKYFSEGLSKGGSAQASSLSRDNNYFQASGYYNSKQDIEKGQATDPKYLNSLPIGTVISAQGGNVHGDGHVQIKLGPNKWVSYFDQPGVLGQRADGRQYHGYSVHIPNEKGLSRINERGFATMVAAPEGQPAPPAPIEEAHDVQQTHPMADRKLDEPTAEIDAQGRPRAIGQAPLAPGEEAAHTNVQIRRKDDPSNVPMYEPGPPSTSAPDVKGLGDASQPTVTTPPTSGEAPVVSPKVVPKGSKEPSTEPAAPKKVSANSYKVDQAGFIAAIKSTPDYKKQTAGIPDFLIGDDRIIDGFNNDPVVKAAGVRYDPATGVMRMKNPDDPRVKEVMSGFDTKSFMTPIEPPKPKVEPVKQVPEKGLEKFMEKPEAPQAPSAKVEPPTIKQFVKGEGYAGLKDVPNPNYKPPTVTQTGSPSATVSPPATQASTPAAKPEEKKETAPSTQPVQKAEPPKAEPKTDTPKIEVKATGGEAPADSHIQAYPIGGLRGDNSVVVDAQQQPLFTMNTKTEAVLPNPQENRVDVIPAQKQTAGVNQQAPNPMQQFSDDLENVRAEIKNAFNDMTVNNNVSGKTARSTISDRDGNMIDTLLDSTRIAYKNPTSQRAFNRSRFHETGDPTNDFHHSIGNMA